MLNGETLLLNASGTTVTNSNEEDISRIGYVWDCPEIFAQFCEDNNSSTLEITESAFEEVEGQYNENYTFSVNISYARADGNGSIFEELS